VSRFPLGLRDEGLLSPALKVFAPRAILTHFMSPFNASLWRLKRRTRARHLVACDQTSGAFREKHGLKWALAFARGRLASLYVDRVVAVSDFVRRRDIRVGLLPESRFQVIHNAVDFDRYSPNGRRPRGDGEPPVIAFAGQLIP
jgi:glycosyltransferase involved in cell wall biosynthesis